MPAGPIGRQRRCALVMAAFDVPSDTMAAALAISEADLREFHEAELGVGQALKHCNVLLATWAMAREGKWPAISWLLRRMEQAERDERTSDDR